MAEETEIEKEERELVEAENLAAALREKVQKRKDDANRALLEEEAARIKEAVAPYVAFINDESFLDFRVKLDVLLADPEIYKYPDGLAPLAGTLRDVVNTWVTAIEVRNNPGIADLTAMVEEGKADVEA